MKSVLAGILYNYKLFTFELDNSKNKKRNQFNGQKEEGLQFRETQRNNR